MFALIVPLQGHDLPGFGGGWGGGGRPDNSLPGGPGHISPPIYHPGHPDHGLPIAPGHPGNRPPGSWGGPVDPGFGGGGPDHPWWGGGRPNRPDNSLPIYHPGHPDHGLPSTPEPKAYAAAPESGIPEHPAAPNPDLGEWVLVALGDRQMGWAWLDKTQAQPK